MTLVRYRRNFEPSSSFSGLFDRLFQDTVNDYKMSRFNPQVDVSESEKNYGIEVAVPGMEKNDFVLEVNENTLTVSGERKMKDEVKERNYHTLETYYGSFSRSFELPADVDSSKIEASYKNGILYIDIPKDSKAIVKSEIKVK